jgi:hypothetical protein
MSLNKYCCSTYNTKAQFSSRHDRICSSSNHSTRCIADGASKNERL